MFPHSPALSPDYSWGTESVWGLVVVYSFVMSEEETTSYPQSADSLGLAAAVDVARRESKLAILHAPGELKFGLFVGSRTRVIGARRDGSSGSTPTCEAARERIVRDTALTQTEEGREAAC